MYWRFLDTGANDAFYNMALDEAIYQSFKNNAIPSTIRCYTFSPPAITIGYLQDIKEIDYKRLDVVRRLTGGRAVVHNNDITYSMVFKEDDKFFGGSTLETYKSISQVFMQVLKRLKIKAELVKVSSKQKNSSFCFDAPSRYELVVNGEKILGSAQRREDGVVLQQGSLALKGGLFLENHSKAEVIDILKVEMENIGIKFNEQGLTAQEMKLVESLISKYKSYEWNFKKRKNE